MKIDKNVAAEKFDKKYGGIRQALTKGYLPGYLKREHMPLPRRKKKLAVLVINSDVNYTEFRGDVLKEKVNIVKLNEKDEEGETVHEDISIVGALNWLHSHGYTEQLDVLEEKPLGLGVLSITFAGYLPTMTNEENEPSVFTPEVQSNNCGCTKEFVMVGCPSYEDPQGGTYFVERDSNDNDPSKTRKISGIGKSGWLAKNGYFTCETAFGDLLQAFMEGPGDTFYDPPSTDRRGRELNRYPFKIYSRPKYPTDEMENESDQEMTG